MVQGTFSTGSVHCILIRKIGKRFMWIYENLCEFM